MKVHFGEVNRALIEHGFTNTSNLKGRVSYSGFLHVAPISENIPVKIIFLDRKMKKPPIIKLENRPDWIPSVCPHLSGCGQLCYMDTNKAYLPRWDYPGAVITCIRAAEDLLAKIARGEVEEGIRGEFLYYWEGNPLLIDIPDLTNTQNFTNLGFFNIKIPGGRDLQLIGTNREYLEKGYNQAASGTQIKEISLYSVDIALPLGLIQGEWPPQNLYDFLSWSRELSPKIEPAIQKSLRDIYDRGMSQSLVLVKGINCSCAISIVRNTSLLAYRKYKNGREFSRRVLSSAELLKKTQIIRFGPLPVDPRSWITRNDSGDRTGLAGKNILVLGAGSVGGYLCDILAKMGAGQLGGEFIISDEDILSPGNLGRHILGFPEIGKKKSNSLCEKLKKMYPHSVIRSCGDSEIYNPNVDLIIDATGSKEISHYLNEIKITGMIQPDIIFTWVVGEGIGSQALYVSDKNFACLNCLDIERPGGNHSLLKPGHDSLFIEGSGGCGDWLVPFDVTAAMHSASLAGKVALDWSNGATKPHFRSILTDSTKGKNVKNGSPKPNNHCPICSK